MAYLSTGASQTGSFKTSGKPPGVDLPTALFQALAPDGGLYLPERLPPLPESFFKSLRGADLATTALRVMANLLPEIPPEDLRRIVEDALDFPIPLVEIEDSVHILELFHGPTLAFKDVGARFMARLFAYLGSSEGSSEADRPLTVLAATSGDTGSAVAQAFLGVPGTRVAVLYPQGKVSEIQECQFTTLGDNVQALAVDGTFDDCQRMVKAAFADQDLSAQLRLTSANSINLGRLLPQSIYYFHALSQLPQGAPAPFFAVPSGNFGNLTAGLLAHRLGLPVAGFAAATNANDVVPDYLESGLFSPRPSVATISNAMDVGNPSNFSRILQLFEGDLDAIRAKVQGSRHGDAETRQTIQDVYKRTGYTLDPHTAVGYLGLQQALKTSATPVSGIVLATAHPVKFRETVEPLIGKKIPIPQRLAQYLDLPRRSLPLAPEDEALQGFLREW